MSTHHARLGMGRQLAQQARPFLPIDTPPRTTNLPQSALVGLGWDVDLGTVTTPVPRPFTQYQSAAFPFTHGSNVGPAAIKPKYGYSTNTYSPAAHRLGGVIMEGRPAAPVVRGAFIGRGRHSLGRSTGRIRGAVAPFPPVNPSWRSMFGGRVQ